MLRIGRKMSAFALIALVWFALCPALAQAQAAYRTIIIFGDTQTVVNGAPGQIDVLRDQVDWVVANKYTENIDLVLHVGDIIHLGTFAPVPASCSGQPVVSLSSCLSAPTCDPAPAGCFSIDNGVGGTDCVSCSWVQTTVPDQWQRFTDQWTKFNPDPGSGWDGIPYAIVRGNHDNAGTDPGTELGIAGYNQFYGEAALEDLESQFAGTDRVYEHLETYPGEEMDGHAWRFQIGNRPILVVGPSYQRPIGTSQEQIDWVIDVFDRNPDIPGVLLVHDMIENSQLYSSVVQQMPTLAPNLFMTAQGHIVQDIKFIQDIGGFEVMRTVSDWSYREITPIDGSYFAILRFYFEPGEDDEVEAFTYSPALDEVVADPDTMITKQVFMVPEPESWLMQLAALGAVCVIHRRRRRSSESSTGNWEPKAG